MYELAARIFLFAALSDMCTYKANAFISCTVRNISQLAKLRIKSLMNIDFWEQ